MANQRVTGAQPPVGRADPVYDVLRIQKHGPLDVTLLSDTVSGVVTHYVTADEGGGASYACMQHEPGGCDIHDEPLEWAGFVPVWCHKGMKYAILRLAPKEYDVLAAVLGVDMRWKWVRIKLTPTNAGKGKRALCERVSEHMPVARVEPQSMERTICRVLKCDHVPRQSPPAADPDPEVAGL